MGEVKLKKKIKTTSSQPHIQEGKLPPSATALKSAAALKMPAEDGTSEEPSLAMSPAAGGRSQ